MAWFDNPAFKKKLGGDVTDTREQLFNAGEQGPIEQIQVSQCRIAQLRGILIDLDPQILTPNPLTPRIPLGSSEFFTEVVDPWLQGHPTLIKAAVRNSGRGLHVLFHFREPVPLETDGQRDRWDGIVRVIQSVLPSDPDAPSITAVTRPVGSVNGKNGARVELLQAGEPISPDEVVGLYEDICHAPFKTIFTILAGSSEISPCPLCESPGSALKALDFTGSCYGNCGKVSLAQFYDMFFAPRP